MKIVVFGGTGDVGRSIVEKLVAGDKQVVVLTRRVDQPSVGNLHYVVGNVLDYSTVEKCMHRNDQIIISLGFNDSALDTMSRGTKNIIEAMQ